MHSCSRSPCECFSRARDASGLWLCPRRLSPYRERLRASPWQRLTFDVSTPSYFGRGQELSQLLAFLERQRDNDRYSLSFEQALRNFSAYLSNAPRVDDEPERTLLFGSDVHNNALVLPALGRFADGEPTLLAGDFGHRGNEAEARLIAPRIAALGDDVVAVSGNHDSRGLMQALAKEGVTVLGDEGRLRSGGGYTGSPLLRLGGVTLAGFPDPLEWEGDDPDDPKRIFSFPELDEGDALEQEAKTDIVAWFHALPTWWSCTRTRSPSTWRPSSRPRHDAPVGRSDPDRAALRASAGGSRDPRRRLPARGPGRRALSLRAERAARLGDPLELRHGLRAEGAAI